MKIRYRILSFRQNVINPVLWRLAQWIAPREINWIKVGWPADMIFHDPRNIDSFVPTVLVRSLRPDEIVAYGFQFAWKGRLCRVAVKMHAAPNADELGRAMTLLSAAMADPENPKSCAAFGSEDLISKCLDARKL